jgi:hypothetical protein
MNFYNIQFRVFGREFVHTERDVPAKSVWEAKQKTQRAMARCYGVAVDDIAIKSVVQLKFNPYIQTGIRDNKHFDELTAP